MARVCDKDLIEVRHFEKKKINKKDSNLKSDRFTNT